MKNTAFGMLTLALALALVPSVAAAQESPSPRDPSAWEARLFLDVRWHPSRTFDAFMNADALASPGLSIGRNVIDLGNVVTIGVSLDWRYESTSASVAQAVRTQASEHAFSASAIARLTLSDWLQPYLRLGGGAGYHEARLTPGSGVPLLGDAWSGFGELGGGLLLRTSSPLGTDGWLQTLSLGFVVEGGYTLGSTPGLTLAPRAPTNPTDPIVSQPLVLGGLDTSSPFLRMSLVVRF